MVIRDPLNNNNGYDVNIDLLDLGIENKGSFNIYKYGALQFKTKNMPVRSISLDDSLVSNISFNNKNIKDNDLKQVSINLMDNDYKKYYFKIFFENKTSGKIISRDIKENNIFTDNSIINEIIDNEYSFNNIDIYIRKYRYNDFGLDYYGPISNILPLMNIKSNIINYYTSNYHSPEEKKIWNIDANRKIILLFEKINQNTDRMFGNGGYSIIRIELSNNIIKEYINQFNVENDYIIIEDSNDNELKIIYERFKTKEKGFLLHIINVDELISNNVNDNDVYDFIEKKYKNLNEIDNKNWVSLKKSIIDNENELQKPVFLIERENINDFKINIYKDDNKTNKYENINKLNYKLDNNNIINSYEQSIKDDIYIKPNNNNKIYEYPYNNENNITDYNLLNNNSINKPFKNKVLNYKFNGKVYNNKMGYSEDSNEEILNVYSTNINISFPNDIDNYATNREYYWELKFYGKVYIIWSI